MIETLMGALVLAVAALFVVFAYSSADLRPTSGYTVSANFNKVTGIGVGSDVRMAGIKIGTVVDQSLDPQTYLASITMSIDDAVVLPDDSTAAITTEGLLGGSYLEIVPGGSPMTLEDGGIIEFTQDPVDIVQMLGKFIFSAAEQQGNATDSGN